jgi:hypothetical protein
MQRLTQRDRVAAAPNTLRGVQPCAASALQGFPRPVLSELKPDGSSVSAGYPVRASRLARNLLQRVFPRYLPVSPCLERLQLRQRRCACAY